MLGPIDFIVVGFKGNNFDGSILAELGKAVDSGVIRVVDLLFVVKDAEGNILGAEVEDQSEELKAATQIFGLQESLQLLTEDDMQKVAESMDNDTAAGVLVIEHLWAKGLKKALIDAGGVLLDEGRIHTDTVEAALADLEAAAKEEAKS